MTDTRPAGPKRPHRAAGARAVATGLGLTTTLGLTAVMAASQPGATGATATPPEPAPPAAPAAVVLATTDSGPSVVRLEPLPQATPTTAPQVQTHGSR